MDLLCSDFLPAIVLVCSMYTWTTLQMLLEFLKLDPNCILQQCFALEIEADQSQFGSFCWTMQHFTILVFLLFKRRPAPSWVSHSALKLKAEMSTRMTNCVLKILSSVIIKCHKISCLMSYSGPQLRISFQGCGRWNPVEWQNTDCHTQQ